MIFSNLDARFNLELGIVKLDVLAPSSWHGIVKNF
jgi:hypothetical protein